MFTASKTNQERGEACDCESTFPWPWPVESLQKRSQISMSQQHTAGYIQITEEEKDNKNDI